MKELQNLERIAGTLGKIRHTDNGIIVQLITETDLILPLNPDLAERLEQLMGQKIGSQICRGSPCHSKTKRYAS